MPWFKVDDKLHDHRKARKAGKAAMGVWVLAGSWSMDNGTDGFVPDDVLARWGTQTDARALVAVGLWDREDHDGESGYRFHDWTKFQPSAAVAEARRAKESEAALLGNHRRWHVRRGVTDPDCEFCHLPPDRVPDLPPDRGDIGSASGDPSGLGESAPNRPVPVPVPQVSPNGDTSRQRDDVERICDHLANRIAEDGSKRPSVGKGWHDAARLMLDKDGRTEAEVHAAIDWCQNHAFWRTNILSMPTLREKYDRLRKVAESERGRSATRGGIDWDAAMDRARQLDAQREAAGR